MGSHKEYSESGAPIYRYDRVNEWKDPVFSEEHITKLEEHMAKFLGETYQVWHEIVSDTVHIDVHHIRPTSERNYHILITTGMSYLPMHVPEGFEDWKYAELMICLPPDWPINEEAFRDEKNYWPVRLLKMLARFPHKFNTWLYWGHTVRNGDPIASYAENTKLCSALLLVPLGVPEDFLSLKINEDITVRFFSIYPIYKEEMEYKLKYGVDALLDKFDAYDINEVVAINRKNVCE